MEYALLRSRGALITEPMRVNWVFRKNGRSYNDKIKCEGAKRN